MGKHAHALEVASERARGYSMPARQQGEDGMLWWMFWLAPAVAPPRKRKAEREPSREAATKRPRRTPPRERHSETLSPRKARVPPEATPS
ncbi:hypothetical protein DRW03_12720 [Corallococcus sp. H22C18031201]|nr:hypothetical protein DRW03_12720 [Corallococcus sp. H22C18031201]